MGCLSFIFRRSRRKTPAQTIDIPEAENMKIYSYSELRNATNDFSSDNKIGQGGFGYVYKGKLKDGSLVAVKVLSSHSTQGAREFVNELIAISDIVHENLVQLYGCCVEGDHRILVYNYIENNSLAKTLLGGFSSIRFDWKTRREICIGIARGLAFLHEEVHPCIIHRDIKASNILLDKNLTPKISDFGFAKLFPSHLTHISTRVAGTIGYLAPEYAIRGQLTKKADIYSFGILLLEIVTGSKNKNSMLPSEDQFLLERTWRLFEQDEIKNIVDDSIKDESDREEACRFLKIALVCTQDPSRLRPSMPNVMKMLNGEQDTDMKITKPSLIADLMNLKVRSHTPIVVQACPPINSPEASSESSANRTPPSFTVDSTDDQIR